MKRYIKIFIMVIFTQLGITTNAQTTVEKTNSNDNISRAILASYYLEIPLNFDSPTAEACVNLLMSAHRNNTAYPVLPLEKLSSSDKIKIENLQRELLELRNNPPSWNEILVKEEAKLAVKYAPPSAPVFAGDMGRKENNIPKNQLHLAGASNNTTYTIVEQSTQHNEEAPVLNPAKD
jgi:hypothetical protein